MVSSPCYVPGILSIFKVKSDGFWAFAMSKIVRKSTIAAVMNFVDDIH
jgi:hypothetical protein